MFKRNKRWISKLSGATALIMTVSLALPLLAFAQSYVYQATYDKTTGTVTASVYTDEAVTGNVYLNIMDGSSSVIDSVYMAAPSGDYTVNGAVYDRYDFSYTVTKNVYDRLKLESWYTDGTDTVTSSVYEVVSSHTPPSGGGGGSRGGGGGYYPGPILTPSDADVTTDANGAVGATALAAAFDREDVVTISLTGDVALLPAKTLANAGAGKTIVLEKDGVTLTLPLKALKLGELAEQIDTALEALTIRVAIEALDGEDAQEVEAAATKAAATLRSEAVSFELTAVGDDDREVAIDDFDGTYVARTIPVEEEADASKLIGALYDANKAELVFVPTELVFDEDGNVTAAKLKRPGNSVYAVVERTKSFLDIAGHWAQEEIEDMAGKLLVEGVSAQQFEPNRSITRAEFATLLVRALGLSKKDGGATFTDVSSTDWFADAVATAADAELVNGYPDGSFQPNATISRAEMAAMIVRAMEYVYGYPPQMYLPTSEIESLLADFEDADELDWARVDMAVAVKEGIVEGMTETTLAPAGNATRAQATVMLQRWLTHIKFI
ncbi:S-layer homology domain-containing protein [Paenibacillus sp. TRM 82003]|nr:S-layer homology domain-containing protein [Paenibacillus sp. TRM 82003]